MANDSIITDKGKTTILYRAYTQTGNLSTTEYKPAEEFQLGVNQTQPLTSATSLTKTIPISNGTICDDGSNTMTGSNGGDNTTDNTTTFKQGGNVIDGTAQNLIANNTSITKTWSISDLTVNGAAIDDTKFLSIWLYILDAAALAKFAAAGSVIVKVGSDSSNYYSMTFAATVLSVGWNWLTSGTNTVADLTETGTVTGTINYFEIQITTNNATDTFVAGDVVYDLLRQWTISDTKKSFISGYPQVDTVNNEVTTRAFVSTIEANGFDIDGLGFFNTDTSPLLLGLDKFIAESKSETDEFTFIVKTRIL